MAEPSYTVTVNSDNDNIPQKQTQDVDSLRQQMQDDFDAKVQQIEDKYEEKLEATRSRAVEEAEKRVVNRIVGEKEEEKWVPKTYVDVKDKAVEESVAIIEKKRKDEQEKLAAEKKQKNEELKKKQEEYNKVWNDQLDKLAQENRIPSLDLNTDSDKEIKRKLDAGENLSDEEMNHPHVKARSEIFALAKEHSEPNLRLVYYDHVQNKNKEVEAQKNAPVFGAGPAVSDDGKGPGYTYEEIHSSNIEDLV